MAVAAAVVASAVIAAAVVVPAVVSQHEVDVVDLVTGEDEAALAAAVELPVEVLVEVAAVAVVASLALLVARRW